MAAAHWVCEPLNNSIDHKGQKVLLALWHVGLYLAAVTGVVGQAIKMSVEMH